MPTPDFSMEIIEYLKFGERIQRWSKGEEDRPATVGDLIDIAGGELQIGDGYKTDAKSAEAIEYFFAPATGTISIIIPHEDDLAGDPPTPYPLPTFYEEAINAGSLVDGDSAKAFRSRRIADYAMRKCV